MARFPCPDKGNDRIRAQCLTCLSVHSHPNTRISLFQTANAAPHSAADAPPPPSTIPTPGHHLLFRQNTCMVGVAHSWSHANIFLQASVIAASRGLQQDAQQ